MIKFEQSLLLPLRPLPIGPFRKLNLKTFYRRWRINSTGKEELEELLGQPQTLPLKTHFHHSILWANCSIEIRVYYLIWMHLKPPRQFKRHSTPIVTDFQNALQLDLVDRIKFVYENTTEASRCWRTNPLEKNTRVLPKRATEAGKATRSIMAPSKAFA